MSQRQRRAPRRAQNPATRAARAAAISLSLPAIVVLTGPASAAAPNSASHHATHIAKTLSAVKSSVASSDRHQKKLSTTATNKGAVSHKTRVSNALLAGHSTKAPAFVDHSQAISTSSPKTGHQVTKAVRLRPATPPPARHIAHQAQAPSQPALVPLGTFMVTCYDLYGTTASGAQAGPESVAVDPSVIPLGTHIYVPGIGERTADDTGGLIIGDHIDIWEPTYAQCADWGVRELPIYRVQ